LPDTPGTWSHLDRAGPGVEDGGPRCVGTLILGVEAAGAATAPVAALVAPVVVLLLAGLLRWPLLLLLLSGGAYRPTGRGRRRRWLGHAVERGGGSGSLQPLGALFNFLQAEVVMHLLERREGCHVREDGTKVIEVLVQPTENV
jgi:hypothetical protein